MDNIQYFCTLVPNPGWKGPSGLLRSDWGGQEDKMLIFDNIKFVELTLR